MAEYLIDKAYLVALADAIRKKSGSSSKMTPSAMVSAINNLGDMTYTPQSSPTVINKTGELYTIQDTTFNSLAKAIRNKAGISDKMTPHKMIDVVNGLNRAQAFAVFSADDNSLNFYKRLNVPKVGEQFEGKTATKIYTGIETLEIDRASGAPWHYDMIESVKVVDRISPISTASWFRIFNSSGGGSNRSYQNKGHSTIRSIDIKNLDTSKVKDMSQMFYYCDSIEQIDLSGFNTSKVTNMHNMFFYCRSLTTMNLSMFDTSNVADMGTMFCGCTRLSNLDLSGWDTSSVTSVTGMIDMFQSCEKLQQVKFGDRFMWSGTNGYLPTQKSTYIPNADGKWYAASDGKGYAPSEIPNNKADTYYAYPPQAFAVYSDDDKSLNFYKRFNKPKIGSQFNNKSVTNVYTWNNEGQVSSEVSTFAPEPTIGALFNCGDNVQFVGIVDKILAPKSIEYWFCEFTHVTNINLSNFDTSNTTNMSCLFRNNSVVELDLSMLNTTNVQYLDGMFYDCKSLKNLDISNFDTTNVGLLNLLFLGCPSLQRIKVGNKFTLGKYLPAQNSINVPNADGKWYAMSDGTGYAPENIPSNKADTYVASKTLLPPELQPKEAFAVYSDDDKSLNFYKRTLIPKAGEQFDGRTATNVYTEIENTNYNGIDVLPPWHDIRHNIKQTIAIDKISPVSMDGWFSDATNLHTADLNKIDVSNTTSLSGLFCPMNDQVGSTYNRTYPFRVNIKDWNIQTTCNIEDMFDPMVSTDRQSIGCIILGANSSKVATSLPYVHDGAMGGTGNACVNIKTGKAETHEQMANGTGGEYVFYSTPSLGYYSWNGGAYKK